MLGALEAGEVVDITEEQVHFKTFPLFCTYVSPQRCPCLTAVWSHFGFYTSLQVLEIGASRLRFERPAGGSSNGGAAGPVGWVSANGPTGLPFLVLVGSDAE